MPENQVVNQDHQRIDQERNPIDPQGQRPREQTQVLKDEEIPKAIAFNKGRNYPHELWKAIQLRVETAADGLLGRNTVLAVAQWQKDKGLSVDGMVGPATLKAINPTQAQEKEEEKEKEKEEKTTATGATFEDKAVEDMKDYFVQNATSGKADPCITTMNKGLRKLYGKNLKVGSTVQDTMALMEKGGMVSSKKVIEFLDDKGRQTTGVREPQGLSESPSAWLLEQCKGQPGWHVFGMSNMDGYHSITMTVDNRDPSAPKIFWSDQWSSHGGFKEHTPSEFDEKLARLTNSWWNGYKTEKGYPPRSRLTFWKLQTPGNP